jgi:Rad3-related DNA helicase
MATMSEILGPGGVISRRLPGYESRPAQVAMAETVATALETRRHAIIEGGTGVGKALDVDTPIATPTGWKRLGDLCVGDMVFDETGSPTQVVRAFDILHDRPCYEIAFSDGSTLVADEQHEWISYTWRDRKRASRRREAGPRQKNVATGDTLTRVQSLLDTAGTFDTISVTETERLIGGHSYSVWRATQDLAPVAVRGQRRLHACATLLAAVLAQLESDLDDRRADALPFSRLTTRDIASTLTVNVGNHARLNHAVPVAPQLFRLPRKIAAHEERLRTYTPARNELRYITAVRPVPSRPVRCIQVAATSHLYLAGESLIPTHNSLAYLIPAIYSGKKVIISTANKALQDQLVGKDIPFLQHALPREVTAALVKGRSNYLCLDRLDEEERFQTMAGPSPDYRRIKAWAAGTRTGDFEELPTLPARDLLGRVGSTTRTCIGSACQYFFGECFVEKMRARAEKAALVVCNHALLLADLVVRDMGAYLLPDRDAVIIDEAHRLEETALDAFTRSLSRRDVAELAENTLLRRHVGEAPVAVLPDLADTLFRPLELAVGAYGIRPARASGLQADRASTPTSFKLTEQLDGGLRLAEALAEIAERLIRQDPFRDTKTSTRESRHYEKLVEWTSRLAEDTRIISKVNDEDSVRYVERGAGPRFAEVTAKWTPVDVSEPLAEILFRQTPVICTSATLAVGDFSYFRRAVGIADAAELVAPSPFDYPRQCLLYVPSHLPEFRGAATPEYTAALCAEIERLVRASGGRAFLLFTSYRGLEDAYAALATRLPYTVLKQSEAPRGELLRRFRADGAAVLFGTRSFWEGVDVVGDALSLVVIDRMPFTVPDDPVVSTRVERMKRAGQDWFNDLMLPTAILQLKQGVGRLIRSRTDHGVVAILDSRLARRSYGVRVIRALPPARLVRRIAEVESFFEVGGT